MAIFPHWFCHQNSKLVRAHGQSCYRDTCVEWGLMRRILGPTFPAILWSFGLRSPKSPAQASCACSRQDWPSLVTQTTPAGSRSQALPRSCSCVKMCLSLCGTKQGTSLAIVTLHLIKHYWKMAWVAQLATSSLNPSWDKPTKTAKRGILQAFTSLLCHSFNI